MRKIQELEEQSNQSVMCSSELRQIRSRIDLA